MMLPTPDAASAPLIRDRALRRQIDRCIGRALFDSEYARLLLCEPTLVLENDNCLPQDYLSLQSINAGCLIEFAQQARALFWLTISPARAEVDTPSSSSSRHGPGARLLIPITAAT